MKEVNKTEEKINFILPDFLNVPGCTYLLSASRNHPEIFKENMNVFGFYTKFLGTIWNEENIKNYKKFSIDELKNLYEGYLNQNTHLIIKFDSKNLSKKELNCVYGNLILSVFENEMNYVWVNDYLLHDYIKTYYPKFKIISCYESADLYIPSEINDKRVTNESKVIFPDNNFIQDYSNMYCHKKSDSKINKISPKRDSYYSKRNNISFVESQKMKLRYEEIVKLRKNGFKFFILSGAGLYNCAAAINVIDYIYKDEYKNDAQFKFFTDLFNTKINEVDELYK